MEYEHLNNEEVTQLLEQYGPNEIVVISESALKKFLKFVFAPMTVMLFLAASFSFVLHKTFDAYFISFLIALNIFIGFWHEKKADDTIKKLKETLALHATVLRGGAWNIIDVKFLVPGDVVRLGIGDIVPADGIILDAKHLSLNESSLTGESLPVEKVKQDELFAGTYILSGACIVRVTGTGNRTRFGKTLVAIEGVHKRSMLEEDILSITKYLMTLSLFAVVVLSATFLYLHKPFLEMLELDLALIIAGIPVSLPTVMTLITSIGILALAKKDIIVRRISSLENLSNVNLLLSDKTGTLTTNIIRIDRVVNANDFSPESVIALATVAEGWDGGVIQESLRAYAKKMRHDIILPTLLDFTPYDSDRKRSTASVEWNNETWIASFGAPQIIKDLCVMSDKDSASFEEMIDRAAHEGYRTMSLAVKKGSSKEGEMLLAGTIFLTDTLRPNAKEVIDFMRDHGIETKLVTGDNHAISERVANELGLSGSMRGKKDVTSAAIAEWKKEDFDTVSVFSEVLPIDKYHIVEYAKKEGRIVAVTGDGINDIPPVRAADVGIAVRSAVPALKESADIVLLTDGIDAIQEAILEARKIFVRMTGYGVYRISESFRVIFGLLILGLLYKEFPLQPIHLIILALLNDIPIISLAFNRVQLPDGPPVVNAHKRALAGSVFGVVGIVNSLLFFFLLHNILHYDWALVQTLFFLKLSVSGHLLIFVTHTKGRWWKYLPSPIVIIAIIGTQFIATAFAYTGFLMAQASVSLIIFVWLWAFFWMQVSDQMKRFKGAS